MNNKGTCRLNDNKMDVNTVWQWRILHVKKYSIHSEPFHYSNEIGLDFNIACNTQKDLDLQLVTNGVILEVCDFAKTVSKNKRHFITNILENNFSLGLENEQQRSDFTAQILHKVNDLIRNPPKDESEVFTLSDMSSKPGSATVCKTKSFLLEIDDSDDSEHENKLNCLEAISKDHIETESLLDEMDRAHAGDSEQCSGGQSRKELKDAFPPSFPQCEEIGLNLDVGSKQSLDPRLLTKGVMLEVVDFTRVLAASYSRIILDVLEHNFELDLKNQLVKNRIWFNISHLLKRRKQLTVIGSTITPEFNNEPFSLQTFARQHDKRGFCTSEEQIQTPQISPNKGDMKQKEMGAESIHTCAPEKSDLDPDDSTDSRNIGNQDHLENPERCSVSSEIPKSESSCLGMHDTFLTSTDVSSSLPTVNSDVNSPFTSQHDEKGLIGGEEQTPSPQSVLKFCTVPALMELKNLLVYAKAYKNKKWRQRGVSTVKKVDYQKIPNFDVCSAGPSQTEMKDINISTSPDIEHRNDTEYMSKLKRRSAMHPSIWRGTIKKRKLALQAEEERATLTGQNTRIIKTKTKRQSREDRQPICTEFGFDLDVTSQSEEKEKLDLMPLLPSQSDEMGLCTGEEQTQTARNVPCECDVETEEIKTEKYYTCPIGESDIDSDEGADSGNTGNEDHLENSESCSVSSDTPKSESSCLGMHDTFLTSTDVSSSLPTVNSDVNSPFTSQHDEKGLIGGEEQTPSPQSVPNKWDTEQEEMGTENNMWKLRSNRVEQIVSSQNKEFCLFTRSKKLGLEFNVGFGPKQNMSVDCLTNAILLEIAKFAIAINSSQKEFIMEILEYNFNLGLQSQHQRNTFTHEMMNRVRQLRCCEDAVKFSNEVFELPGPRPSLNRANQSVGNAIPELSSISGMEKCDVGPSIPADSHAESKEHIPRKSADLYPVCKGIGLKLRVNNSQPNRKLEINTLTNGAMTEVTKFAEKLCGTFEEICLDILRHNFDLDLQSGDSDPAKNILARIPILVEQNNLSIYCTKGKNRKKKGSSGMFFKNNPNLVACSAGSSQAAITDQNVGSSTDGEDKKEINLKLWKLRTKQIQHILSMPHEENCPLYSYSRCKKLGIDFHVGSGVKQNLDPKFLTNGIMAELNAFASALLSSTKHFITEILEFNFNLDLKDELYRSAFAQKIMTRLDAFRGCKKGSETRWKIPFELPDMRCIQEPSFDRTTYCPRCYQERNHKIGEDQSDSGHVSPCLLSMTDTVSAHENYSTKKPVKDTSSTFSTEEMIMNSNPRCKKIGLTLCVDKDRPTDKLDTQILTRGVMMEVENFAKKLCGTKFKILHDLLEHNFNISMQQTPFIDFVKMQHIVKAEEDDGLAYFDEVFVFRPPSQRQPGHVTKMRAAALAIQRSDWRETIQKRKIALQTKEERATLPNHNVPSECDMAQEEMRPENYYTCPLGESDVESDQGTDSGNTGNEDHLENPESCSVSSDIPKSESSCLGMHDTFLTSTDVSSSLPTVNSDVNSPFTSQHDEKGLIGGEEQTPSPQSVLNKWDTEQEEMGTENNMWKLRSNRVEQIISSQNKEFVQFSLSKRVGLEFNVGFGPKQNISVNSLTTGVKLEIAKFAIAINSSQKEFIMEILEYNFNLGLQSQHQRNTFTHEMMNRVRQLRCCEDAVKFSNEVFELPGPRPSLNRANQSVGNAIPELSSISRIEKCDVGPSIPADSHAESKEHIPHKSADLYPLCKEVGLKLRVNNSQPNRKLEINTLTNGAMTEVTKFAEKLCGTFEEIFLDILRHNFDLDLQSGDSDPAKNILARIPILVEQKNLSASFVKGRSVKKRGHTSVGFKNNPNLEPCRAGSSQATITDQNVGSSFNSEHKNELNLKLWKVRTKQIQHILSMPHEENCPLYSYSRCKKLGIDFHVGSGVKQNLDPKFLTNGIMAELNAFVVALLSSTKHFITEILEFNFNLDLKDELYRSAFAQGIMARLDAIRGCKKSCETRWKIPFELPDMRCIQEPSFDRTTYCPRCYQERNHKIGEDQSDAGHVSPCLQSMTDTVSAHENYSREKPVKDTSSTFSTIEEKIMNSNPQCKKIGLTLCVDKERPTDKLDTQIMTRGVMMEVENFAKKLCGTKFKILHDLLEHNFNISMQQATFIDFGHMYRKMKAEEDDGVTYFDEVFVFQPPSQRQPGLVTKMRAAALAIQRSGWRETIQKRKIALQTKEERATLPNPNKSVVASKKNPWTVGKLFPICTEIGLDLHVTSKSEKKEKLDLNLLTTAVVYEIHKFVTKNRAGCYFPGTLFDILDYNFDLSSQHYRRWEFTIATAFKVQNTVKRYRQNQEQADKVFKLPFVFPPKKHKRYSQKESGKYICPQQELHFYSSEVRDSRNAGCQDHLQNPASSDSSRESNSCCQVICAPLPTTACISFALPTGNSNVNPLFESQSDERGLCGGDDQTQFPRNVPIEWNMDQEEMRPEIIYPCPLGESDLDSDQGTDSRNIGNQDHLENPERCSVSSEIPKSESSCLGMHDTFLTSTDVSSSLPTVKSDVNSPFTSQHDEKGLIGGEEQTPSPQSVLKFCTVPALMELKNLLVYAKAYKNKKWRQRGVSTVKKVDYQKIPNFDVCSAGPSQTEMKDINISTSPDIEHRNDTEYVSKLKRKSAMHPSIWRGTIKKRKLALQAEEERATLTGQNTRIIKTKTKCQSREDRQPICTEFGFDLHVTSQSEEKEKLDLMPLLPSQSDEMGLCTGEEQTQTARNVPRECDVETEEIKTEKYYTCPIGESDIDSDEGADSGNTGNEDHLENSESCSVSSDTPKSESSCLGMHDTFLTSTDVSSSLPTVNSDVNSPFTSQHDEKGLIGGEEQTPSPQSVPNKWDTEQEEMGTENNMWKLRSNRVEQIVSSQNKEFCLFTRSKKLGLEFNVGFGPKQNMSVDCLTNAILLEIAKFAIAINSSQKEFIMEILEYNFNLGLQSQHQRNTFTHEMMNRVRQLRCCEDAVKFSNEVFELPGPRPSLNRANQSVGNAIPELSSISGMEKCDVGPSIPADSHAESKEHIPHKSADLYPLCKRIGLKLRVNNSQPNRKLEINTLTNGAMTEVTQFAEKLCGTFEEICLDILRHNFDLDLQSGDSDPAKNILARIPILVEQKNLSASFVKVRSVKKKGHTSVGFKNNPNLEPCRAGSSQATITDQNVGSSFNSEHKNELNLKLWKVRTKQIQHILSMPHEENCPLYSYSRCKKLGIDFHVGSGVKQNLDPKFLTNGIMAELNAFVVALLSSTKHFITEILEFNFNLDLKDELYRSAFAQGIMARLDAIHGRKKSCETRWKIPFELPDMRCIQEPSFDRTTYCPRCYQERNHKIGEDQSDAGHVSPCLQSMTDTVSAHENYSREKPVKDTSSTFSTIEEKIMNSNPQCKKIGLTLCVDKERPTDKLDTQILTRGVMMEVENFAKKLCGTKFKILHDLLEHNFNISMQQATFIDFGHMYRKMKAEEDDGVTYFDEVFVFQPPSQRQPGLVTKMRAAALAIQRSGWRETIQKRKIALQTKEEIATLPNPNKSVVTSKKNPRTMGKLFPICTEIGLDLDVTSKSEKKEKLDLNLLTTAVVYEIHKFVKNRAGCYFPGTLFDILDYNFDLSSEHHRRLEFSVATASKVLTMVKRYRKNRDLADKVLKLPFVRAPRASQTSVEKKGNMKRKRSSQDEPGKKRKKGRSLHQATCSLDVNPISFLCGHEPNKEPSSQDEDTNYLTDPWMIHAQSNQSSVSVGCGSPLPKNIPIKEEEYEPHYAVMEAEPIAEDRYHPHYYNVKTNSDNGDVGHLVPGESAGSLGCTYLSMCPNTENVKTESENEFVQYYILAEPQGSQGHAMLAECPNAESDRTTELDSLLAQYWIPDEVATSHGDSMMPVCQDYEIKEEQDNVPTDSYNYGVLWYSESEEGIKHE